MRRVHCRKCWQLNPLLSKRCAHCGHVSSLRFGQGIAELVVYVVGAAAAIGAVAWIVVTIL